MKRIIIFTLLISIILISGCSRSKSYIQQEIVKANYCETNEDCVSAGGQCPFGCYIYVNKNEVSRIKNLISSYKSNCIYDCMYCPTVECKNNKCEAVCK